MTAKVLSFISNTNPNPIQYDQSQRKRLLVFYINARYQRGPRRPRNAINQLDTAQVIANTSVRLPFSVPTPISTTHVAVTYVSIIVWIRFSLARVGWYSFCVFSATPCRVISVERLKHKAQLGFTLDTARARPI